MPDVTRFPSAADGRGLKSIAEKVNAMGIKLGAWTIRGIPPEACEAGGRGGGVCVWLPPPHDYPARGGGVCVRVLWSCVFFLLLCVSGGTRLTIFLP